MKTPIVEPVIFDPAYTIDKGKPIVQQISISKADIEKMKKSAIVELVSMDPLNPMLNYNIEFIKAQFDMFGGTAPEVPPVDAPNPKVERMNALSMEHKQMYNGLLTKQKKNMLRPEEKGHLQMFNNYLSGSHSHEQLKGYIGYKQNEAHLPLFGNAPKVENPVASIKNYTPPSSKAPTVESPVVKTPEVSKVDAPATQNEEAPTKKFNYEVLKETEKAMHLKIPSWEATDEYKKSHKQHYHELWIPKSVLAKGDDYAKQFAIEAREKIRTSNPYQKAFNKMPHHWNTMGEYAPKKQMIEKMIPDHIKQTQYLRDWDNEVSKKIKELKPDYPWNRYQADRYYEGSLHPDGTPDEVYSKLEEEFKQKMAEKNAMQIKQKFYYDDNEMKGLKKSQLSMFGDEPPKVDDVKVPTPKAPEVTMGAGENFIKPEHKLTSEDGTWKIKGDPTATAQMHSWIKDKYKKKDIYTYGGLLASGHPIADKIKELHGNNNTAIFEHFNKITGRESGKEKGVGENQLRMSMKDSAGIPLGNKHFQVPDLSKEAKVERDSYPNGEALHRALNANEVSPELHKWHKEYQFNDFHKNKNTGEPYQRSLYNNESESFGKVKANQGNNLSPKDMEKYDLLKQKYEGSEFNDTHKQRLEELDTKANKKMPLSDKFSPEDKTKYDEIQSSKAEITDKMKTAKGAELDSHKEKYKDLTAQESEMLNNYREKLGLNKGDPTGEKGFSYTEDMSEGEQNELADLKNKKEFHKLHKQYNQAPEEHHITKLLKYPMSSNKKVFDDPGQKDIETPSTEPVESKKEPSEPVEEDDKDQAPGLGMDPSQKIEEHFPTVGIQTPSSLQKTLKEYQHVPEESEKEYKPGSMVDFNGSKYSIDKDGGNYVLAKNLDTGKSETLVKGDLENYPTDQKLPAINKMSVQKHMEQHGENGISLEDLYSKMGFPDDAKGKDYIKKRLRETLLKLEHHHETGGYHEPIVNREVGQAHPKEKDEKEKGIMYKIAKSLMDFTAQAVAYIKSSNLIKSFMVELYQKEKSIYEKSLESKDIIDSLQEYQDQEKSLINILDNIQAFTLKKSGITFTEQLNYMLDETTEYLCKSGLRFNMLKSMDDGKFQKAVDAAIALNNEEENHTVYKYNKPKDNAENIATAGAEE